MRYNPAVRKDGRRSEPSSWGVRKRERIVSAAPKFTELPRRSFTRAVYALSEGVASFSENSAKVAKLVRRPPPKRRRANASALRTDVIRASGLLEREELVIGQLRFAREASRREALEMELLEIRRELRLLGFKTL
jgi:hypothetical protein